MEQFVLQSSFFKVLPSNNNLFEESVARLVHLSPQEEEYSSSSWGDIEMYTSSSIANSQRMLTEVNETGVIVKISTWVESNTVKQFYAFSCI